MAWNRVLWTFSYRITFPLCTWLDSDEAKTLFILFSFKLFSVLFDCIWSLATKHFSNKTFIEKDFVGVFDMLYFVCLCGDEDSLTTEVEIMWTKLLVKLDTFIHISMGMWLFSDSWMKNSSIRIEILFKSDFIPWISLKWWIYSPMVRTSDPNTIRWILLQVSN